MIDVQELYRKIPEFEQRMKELNYSEGTINTKVPGALWFVQWLDDGKLPKERK